MGQGCGWAVTNNLRVGWCTTRASRMSSAGAVVVSSHLKQPIAAHNTERAAATSAVAEIRGITPLPLGDIHTPDPEIGRYGGRRGDAQSR